MTISDEIQFGLLLAALVSVFLSYNSGGYQTSSYYMQMLLNGRSLSTSSLKNYDLIKPWPRLRLYLIMGIVGITQIFMAAKQVMKLR